MRTRAITESLNRGAGIGVVLLLLLASGAVAQQGVGSVEVKINSVLAADTNKGCDASLREIRHHLERLFHFSTYHLVRHEDRRTSFGKVVEFDLPGGRILQIQPLGMDGDMIQMELTLFQGDQPLMMTDFKIMNGGVLLVGGPRYEQGALIISIEPVAHAASPIQAAPISKPEP